VPTSSEEVVQECGVGLVRLRRGDRLAFGAPDLLRSGPVDQGDLARILRALRIGRADVVDSAWIDNGPGWVGVLLRDATAVLEVEPDFALFEELKIGVVGVHSDGDADVEVRAFYPQFGIPEDPVTGSLNAGLGQWLAGSRLPASYVAAQGTALQRRGRVHVSMKDGEVWVGGDTLTTITGQVDL
jgi:PhzF family phenazine biosynthesis protein